ncbi:MAG: hypothetical protein HGA85_02880 [Nanoarchaeota archaeon]|nr:hypothetical protein [Nanoarchaeota archaeon]
MDRALFDESLTEVLPEHRGFLESLKDPHVIIYTDIDFTTAADNYHRLPGNQYKPYSTQTYLSDPAVKRDKRSLTDYLFDVLSKAEAEDTPEATKEVLVPLMDLCLNYICFATDEGPRGTESELVFSQNDMLNVRMYAALRSLYPGDYQTVIFNKIREINALDISPPEAVSFSILVRNYFLDPDKRANLVRSVSPGELEAKFGDSSYGVFSIIEKLYRDQVFFSKGILFDKMDELFFPGGICFP